jgi:hypothetical protein
VEAAHSLDAYALEANHLGHGLCRFDDEAWRSTGKENGAVPGDILAATHRQEPRLLGSIILGGFYGIFRECMILDLLEGKARQELIARFAVLDRLIHGQVVVPMA